ncbi:MAG: DNA-directed RNA polymerase subunit G [Desulfurococcales archaeon]|nr:DNA-directed RNA polymerase subunit G [Desulfurococcales archaeon]
MEITAVVSEVKRGALKGQYIVEADIEGGGSLRFDLVGGVLSLEPGDKLSIVFMDDKPSDDELDRYDFCGHGYLVSEDKDKTIFSIWGLIYRFKPPLGLEKNKKYYLCIRKLK